LFKGCKYLQEFIIKYEKQPTQAELAIFYYNRYVESGKMSTLPFLTQKWMQDFLEQYEQFFTEGKDAKVIASSLKKTNKIAFRKQMEVTA
jgi:DNA-binding transcriptional regulator YbjK